MLASDAARIRPVWGQTAKPTCTRTEVLLYCNGAGEGGEHRQHAQLQAVVWDAERTFAHGLKHREQDRGWRHGMIVHLNARSPHYGTVPPPGQEGKQASPECSLSSRGGEPF